MANDRDARAAEMASPDLYTPQRRGFLPPDMVSLMGQSMRFGAWTGQREFVSLIRSSLT